MVIRVRKLNNKGFAITTIVYGLSIMGILLISIIMGVISTNRQHNRELSKKISEELIRYSKTSTAFDSSVSGAQEFTVPSGQSGWYRIELWGAQGGGTKGGLGAYTTGIIELNEDDTIYFYVGRHKTTGLGGEESDVRIRSGGYNDVNSYSTRIMVAAGGGADEGADGGTIVGYNADLKSYGGQYDENFELEAPGDRRNYDGKTNGTLIGSRSNQNEEYWHYFWGHDGRRILLADNRSEFYYGNYTSPVAENNGGDGYLASHDFGANEYGYIRNYGGSNTGGVSFISGYGGNYAMERSKDYSGGVEIQKVKTVNDPVYIHYEGTYNSTTGLYDAYPETEPGRKYVFYDGMMFPGVNKGDGKARITKLMDKTEDVQTLPRHNSKLNNIRYVVSCVDESHSTSYGATIKVMVNGVDYANDRYASGSHITTWNFDTDGRRCTRIDLREEVSGIDELDIWQTDEYRDFKNIRITVGSASDPKCSANVNDECSIVIKDAASYSPSVSETKSYTGTRFSSYQFDSTLPLPSHGNYVIQPVLYENMVMTAPSTADQEQNPVVVDYMSGDINQQWSVEKVKGTKYGDNIYKIINLSRNKALAIKNDENKLGNTLIANREFNGTANEADETQLWRITPMRNGTYTIESVLEQVNSSIETGYIVPQTNKDKDNYNKVIIGKKTINPIVQRWKFISMDYSGKDD